VSYHSWIVENFVIIATHECFVTEEMYVARELVFNITQTKPLVPTNGKAVKTYLAT